MQHLAGAVDSVQQVAADIKRTEQNIADVVARIERIVDTVEKILSPALAIRGGVARLLSPLRR